MPLIEVNGLTVRFGDKTVLDGVSFAIDKGERLGVVGEAGAGKSMAALAMAGLVPEGAQVLGGIVLDGAPLPASEKEIAKLRGRRIGLIFENSNDVLDPLMQVGAQIGEALLLSGHVKDVPAQVGQLLADVGLDAKLGQLFARQLSGAERQLVAVAIALAGEPDLLIADEPVAGLDPIAQRKVLDLLERHSTARGMALMLISSDLKAVAALCTRMMVMRSGQVIEIANKLSIFGSPRHDYTKALIASGRHRARTLMRSPIGPPLLEVKNLTRRFRQPDVSIFEPRPPLLAVNDVTFVLRTGESIALIGPSGAGKSMLARIVAGLDRATRGELIFDHAPYHGNDLPRVFRGDISLVFRDPSKSFNPHLTVGESVAEPLRLEPQRLPEEIHERMEEIVGAVGLSPDMLNHYPQDFSAGLLQRFAIARALITKPRLVVLDDPVGALDVVARGEVLVMLNRLRADFGLTFLIISHDFEMVRIAADRVMVMDKGKIIETGTPAQLLEAPKEALTQALVAARLPEVGIVPAS